MARRETVVVTDDLDGSEGAHTYTFAYEGAQYEVDLGGKNAAKLEKALSPFIQAGRKVGGGGARRRGSRRGGGGSASDAAAVREWARANNIKVPERGRIPQAVRDQYAASSS
jgi:Lsr2